MLATSCCEIIGLAMSYREYWSCKEVALLAGNSIPLCWNVAWIMARQHYQNRASSLTLLAAILPVSEDYFRQRGKDLCFLTHSN